MREETILVIIVIVIGVVLGLLISNGWCRPWSRFNLPHVAMWRIKK